MSNVHIYFKSLKIYKPRSAYLVSDVECLSDSKQHKKNKSICLMNFVKTNKCLFAAISKQIFPEVWNDEVITK